LSWDTFKNRNHKNLSGFWARLRADVNFIEDTIDTMSDLPPQPLQTPLKSPAFRPLAELVHALKFLTRLPIPLGRTIDPPPFNQTLRMFSVAGALIGLLISVVLIAGQFARLPSMMTALIAVAIGMIVTGALHEDGFADTADGLGGGKTRERRLEIMRDSRIGTYGALALIVAVGLRVIAYSSLLQMPVPAIVMVVVASQSFSRALMVDLLWATPPARNNGLSHYAGQPPRAVAMFAILVGLALTLFAGYYTSFGNAVLALGLGLAATALIRRQAVRLIGGQTGDICGAAQVACEITMLTAFLVILH
jgi:adenosylcobinamide-GDP ribazoletransferase